ncbi:MAG: leucine-rich repeat domain-containing protein [Ruminococcaceae bacterium]|nr:leucine-rich repeat domain-containing protein [Oscillospiraceae bacterium]
MKKITLVLLSVLLTLSLCACVAEEEDASNIDAYAAPDYTENIGTGTVTFEDGHAETAVIVGYSGLSTVHKVVIPEEIAEREVSGIGDEAFYQLSTIKSISLPSTVTYIGKFAFSGCTSLETIRIPASVTYIDECAFQGCTSLKSVIFEGNSVESIGDFAFLGCTALESISLPSGLKSIGNQAFGKCAAITSIKAPSTLESIGNLCFYECPGLDAEGALELSASIKEIGDFAFTGISKDYIVAPEGSYAAEYVAQMAEDETEDEAEDETEA